MASEDLENKIKTEDPETLESINKYIDDLKDQAQGDYDFVVKFLKQQFEGALGNNDIERAKFFSEVANETEKRIGRIPYDYDLKTGREKEDITNFLRQQDAEDTRQREQEREFSAQQELAATQEQKAITEGANARGMLDSGIEKRQSQEATNIRNTNVIQPQISQFAYNQALRNEQSRLAQVESNRNLADITTGARRDAEDTQYDYNYGTGKAKLTLEERLAQIDRTKRGELESASSLIEQNKANRAKIDGYAFNYDV